MIKLYLVRHGKTNWNEEHKVQGITDIPLNENGINAAYKLKDEIDLDKIDVIFSSPLKRALDTAKIIADDKKDIIIDERLKERSFGSFEGKYLTLMDLSSQWDLSNQENEYGIEKLSDLMNRTKEFIDFLKENYDNKNILIVSHGCTIKGIYFNNIGYDDKTDFLSFYPLNTTLYEIDLE